VTDARNATPCGWALAVRDSMLRLLGAADEGQAAGNRDPRVWRIVEVTKVASDHAFTAMWTQAMARNEDDEDEVPPRSRPLPVLEPFHDAPPRRELLAIVAAEQERLRALLAHREAEVPDQSAEDAARASFDDSPEGERLHRYQNECSRALLQTLGGIRKLAGKSWSTSRPRRPSLSPRPSLRNRRPSRTRPSRRPRRKKPNRWKAVPKREWQTPHCSCPRSNRWCERICAFPRPSSHPP
jgi:hypothetical protein